MTHGSINSSGTPAVYERLTAKPHVLYGRGLKSNYQQQGIALSKHFKTA